jgi:DNA polymerase III subunit alpha
MRCNLELQFGTYYLPASPPRKVTASTSTCAKCPNGPAGPPEKAAGRGPGSPSGLSRPAGTRARRDRPDGLRGLLPDRRDFIRWAKDNDIPVGPGRGSGAGSLVAYALGITDLDPLEHDLLFERFLNPERISMPDFDIDFCMESATG